MDGIKVKQLAKETGVNIEFLIKSFKGIGVQVESERDLITGQQQLELLKSGHLNQFKAKKPNQTVESVEEIQQIESLRELDLVLTQLMSSQQIQPLIKGDNLDTLIDLIIRLVDVNEDDDGEYKLFAVSMMGRLAAVARSRETQVLSRIDEIIDSTLPSLEILAHDKWKVSDKDDVGKRKMYAAMGLRLVEDDWLVDYCLQEAIKIDTAENARRELLNIALNKFDSVAEWLIAIGAQSAIMSVIENPETKIVRSRRLFSAIFENLSLWKGHLGEDPGAALEVCFSAYVRGQYNEISREKLFSTVDSALVLLVRMLELRFSHAFDAEMYTVIKSAKRVLGTRDWGAYLDASEDIESVRNYLLEAVVVLARQNRTDDVFVSLLADVYGGKSQIKRPLMRHFKEYQDLDPENRDWWIKAGNIKKNRQAEHKIGGSEDQQIGVLMLEIESMREASDKLERAIVPFLEIHDPVFASTAKKVLSGYVGISRISRQLGRLRKLTTTNLKGERMEYNPQFHEMLGGYTAGIRNVKIVRDGIQKDFAGKIKTIVKCWVEPKE
jgi:hypothetical protein